MKLETMARHVRRPPLKTLSEIAEQLGVATTRLMWALRREGAPQPTLKGIEAGHYVTGKNRVWYEPKAVIKWFNETILPDDPAEKRRQYHRDYYAKHHAKRKEAA